MSQYILQIRDTTRTIVDEIEINLDDSEFVDYDEWIIQSIEDYEAEKHERGDLWEQDI